MIRRKLVEDKDVRLLRFWDFEFTRPTAVLSYLAATLNLCKESVGARKCDVRKVDSKEAARFLDKWHIQGNTRASVAFALFYQDDLVALMTFRKPAISRKFDWELARFCVKGRWRVSGGASRLLSAFRKQYAGSIVTYADRRYSVGAVYYALGFKLMHVSKPGYFYYHGKHKVVSRYRAQKHKLPQLLGNTFNPSLSEAANMKANNFLKVYDCGQFVFALDSKLDPGVVAVPHVDIPKVKTRRKFTVAQIKEKLPSKLIWNTDLADDTPIVRKNWYWFTCKNCEHSWEAQMCVVLKNREGGCPRCANRTKPSAFVELLAKNNPMLEYVDGYSGVSKPCRFRFKPTGFKFIAKAYQVAVAGNFPHAVVRHVKELEPTRRKHIQVLIARHKATLKDT